MEKNNNTAAAGRLYKPWLFLFAAVGISWLFGFTAVLLQNALSDPLVRIVAYTGSLSPMAAALVLLSRRRSTAGEKPVRDFLLRTVDVRRIPLLWLVPILLFFPARIILAGLIDTAFGGPGIGLEGMARLMEQPVTIVPMLLFWLLFGPVPEEPGWRGYALDGLQRRLTALTSGIIIGLFWMLWHLPLFFIAGTWQSDQLGFGTLPFLYWAVSLIAESVLYVWVYNNTNRSILAAVLFHFSGNASGELFELSARGELAAMVLTLAAASGVTAFFGAEKLCRRSLDAP